MASVVCALHPMARSSMSMANPRGFLLDETVAERIALGLTAEAEERKRTSAAIKATRTEDNDGDTFIFSFRFSFPVVFLCRGGGECAARGFNTTPQAVLVVSYMRCEKKTRLLAALLRCAAPQFFFSWLISIQVLVIQRAATPRRPYD